MSKRWRKFNFREWRSDEKLRRCSRDVQAIWLDLCGLIYEAEDMGRLSVMDNGKCRPYTRAELCKITGDDWRVMDRALKELVQHGVCGNEGGYLVSRRIAREEQKALQDASNGAKGGNPSLLDKGLAEKGVNPQKPEFQKPDLKQGSVERAPVFDFSDIDGSDLDALEAGCRKWANGSLVPGAGPLILKPVVQLLKPPPGSEPCIMADVRDGIMQGASSLHSQGRQVDHLNYFTKSIIRARDERLKPLPQPELVHEGNVQGRGAGPAYAGGSGAGRYGSGNGSPRSGFEPRSGNLAAAAARRRAMREDEAVVSDEPEDWRDDGLAGSVGRHGTYLGR